LTFQAKFLGLIDDFYLLHAVLSSSSTVVKHARLVS